MHATIHLLRRFFYTLGDLLVQPWRFAVDLWRDPVRGRLLVLGVPSVLAFAVAVVLALVALGSQSRLEQAYSEALRNAEARNRIPEAITYTYKLMQMDPGNRDIKFKLVHLLAKDNVSQHREQNQGLAEAMLLAMAPNDKVGYPAAHVERARLIKRIPNVERDLKIKEMERQLQLALQGDSQNVAARTELAALQMEKGDYAAANSNYQQLFRDNADYYWLLANSLRGLGRDDEAREKIREAIGRFRNLREQASRRDHTLAIKLARAHSRIAEFDAAIAVLAEELEANRTESTSGDDPSSAMRILAQDDLKQRLAEIYLARANSHAVAGWTENPEARQAFLDDLLKAYELDPGNQQTLEGITEFSLRDVPEAAAARAAYDPTLDVDNAPDGALFQVGTREVLAGDRSRGIELLRAGLRRNPRNHAILNNLAYSLIEQRPHDALRFANQAIGLAPNIWNYHDTRGVAHLTVGDYPGATRDLLMAAFQVDRLIKQYQEAMNLEEVARLKPKLAAIYRNLELAYSQQGLHEDAASYARRAEEIEKELELKQE